MYILLNKSVIIINMFQVTRIFNVLIKGQGLERISLNKN